MNANNWTTVNRKSNIKTAYKPPQQREAPVPSFDELYPDTLKCSIKKPVILPAVSFSKKLIDSLNTDIKQTVTPNPVLNTKTSSGLPVRLVVRDLVLPDDDMDNKMMFPPLTSYMKAVQKKQRDDIAKSSRFGLSYEDEFDEYESGCEAVDNYDDSWHDEPDDQEFNADLYN